MSIKSILVVLSREGDPSRVLRRAAMLARRFNARVDVFLCEAEGAYELQHQYDTCGMDAVRRSSLANLRAWMDRLWVSLDIHDVSTTMEVVYETPLYKAVRRKVERSKPDLVVRGIGAGAACTFSVSDSDLVRTCPAPLLLTRGRPWKSKPSVAAAVDISGDESPELIRTVLLAAEGISGCCGASLEVLYAARFDNALPDATRSSRDSLVSRAAAANVHPREAHIISGDPVTAIPEFVARRSYDLLVLGALTHRKAMTALVGTLTARLIETPLDCDLLLVKPSAAAAVTALSA